MAKFPRVQRMCPFKSSIAEHMDGDLCRLCNRQVHDLAAMGDVQREAFLASCSEEICVSYALPRKRNGAAAAISAALSAAVMALPVAAEESAPAPDARPKGVVAVVKGAEEIDLVEITVGGIRDFSKIEYVEHAEDVAGLDAPELPVTYEDAKN